MKCFLCEGVKGVSLINGVHLCKACRVRVYSTCSHCKEEKSVHNFYMRRTNMLDYILKEYKYKKICTDCVSVLSEEVREKGLQECKYCGKLHSYKSSKVDGICNSCERTLVECIACGGYHSSSRSYHVEGGKHVGRACYGKKPGDYLRCINCGRFHVIDNKHTYTHANYLCTTCTDSFIILCDICGSTTNTDNVSKIKGDTICSSCARYRCADCGEVPIRPRRIEDGGSIYCSTCASKRGSAVKQEWNYCPSKFFFHDVNGDTDKLYLGFENEQIIPTATASRSRRDLAKVLAHFREKDIYGVFDGSIGGSSDAHGSNGYEIVSHPRTLSSHAKVKWGNLFTKDQEVHNTCGMHVHMSRSGFNRAHLLRLMQLIYLNDAFTNIIAERLPNEYTQSIPEKLILQDARSMYKPKNNINRGVKVNLCNKHTIELRFYSNVINELSLRKNIEFTHSLYYYTKDNIAVSIQGFLDYSRGNKLYPNLSTFIEMKSKELSKCV